MNVTDTVTIAQFVAANRITMTAMWTDRNPNMDDAEYMDHWKVVIRRPGHTLTTYFSMGYGHSGKAPKAKDVLDCLASDASGTENSFEDWCSEYGYESDESTKPASTPLKGSRRFSERNCISSFCGTANASKRTREKPALAPARAFLCLNEPLRCPMPRCR